MTVINTNVASLKARVNSINANSGMEKAMERLSSGQRINRAADDAAGLAVSSKMTAQLKGINMSVRNAQDGISLVQTAEAAMAEVMNMLTRMRELGVQMNNGVYTNADRVNANLEKNQLIAEITKVTDNTQFNNVTLLDGSYSKELRVGNLNTEVITVTILDMAVSTLATGAAVTLSAMTISTQAGAAIAVTSLDTAISNLAEYQATLGAKQNRLEHTIAYLSNASVLTEQARGRIMDSDFATESSNLAKEQILNQAATAMLAQANQSKQSLMGLIQ
jgi:flagellin